jgi:hypothetical protein
MQALYSGFTPKRPITRRSVEFVEVEKPNVLLGEIELIQADTMVEINVRSSNARKLDTHERLAYVRELVKDLDLTTTTGEQEARRLLIEYDLPEHKIYGLQPPPITDEIRQRVQKLAEQRASGDVS